MKGLKIQSNDWEVKSLGEVVEKFIKGNENINKSRKNDGNYPAVVCRDIFNSEFYIDECKNFVDETTIKRFPTIECGDVLMANSGYTNRNKNGFCLFSGNFNALAGKNIYILKHSQNPKYLSFALSAENTKKQMENFFKESLSSMLSIYLYDIKKLKLPIPTMDIQQKIANFLFSFVEYDKRLNRELERRKKQFQYYKEFLFDFGIGKLKWELKSLGEIATEIYSGSDVTKEQLNTGDHPAIRYKDIYDSSGFIGKCANFVDPKIIRNIKYVNKECLIVAKVSENIEDSGKACAYIGEENVILGGGTLAAKHNQNPKYISYACSSTFVRQQFQNASRRGTIVNFSKSSLEKIQIPLPPLEEQERIVKILDGFYGICEDPEGGLPLLIRRNRMQYEYYRELIFGRMNFEL